MSALKVRGNITWQIDGKNCTLAIMKTKKCWDCKKRRLFSKFYPRERRSKYPDSAAGFTPYCKECTQKRQARYRGRLSPDERRAIDLRHNFGIDSNEWNRLFSGQKGLCAICEIHQSKMGRRFHVDHDHKTGKIRGLLCSNCNSGIGKLQESEYIFFKALNYLKKYKPESADKNTDVINLKLIKEEG